ARDPCLLRHQIVRHAFEQEKCTVALAQTAAAAGGQRFERLPQRGIAVVECDPPLARLVEAGDAVEHSGFAGAVRPDQRGDCAARDIEGKIVDGDEPTEAHEQMLDAQHNVVGLRHQPCPSLTCSAEIVLRSFRKTEGRRVAISPRGRQTMISTMQKPNRSMRYLVGSKSAPKISLRKSRSRMISVPPIIATAAMATPTWLPMPPSTTMERIVADSMNVNDSGEMNPCRAAKNEPANPANIAPIANAVSLVLVVLMPSERQAISSSRSASHARPTGSRRKRVVTHAVNSASARIR